MNNEEASSFRMERARRPPARSAATRGGRAQYLESIDRIAGQNIMPPVRTRTMATPSISSLQRHRLRRHRDEGDSLSESLSTVQEAVDRLNEASNNLSSLLEEPIPRIVPPDILTSEYYGEAEVNRRGAKRRKLDSGPDDQGFKYGYRGQVIPGPLRMEILSCDGGHISEATGRSRITHYSPFNILRNDKSVYCTENSDCNIIFRHMVDTPFNLKKVVIKAPRSGFDAPYDIENILRNCSPLIAILQNPRGHGFCFYDVRGSFDTNIPLSPPGTLSTSSSIFENDCG